MSLTIVPNENVKENKVLADFSPKMSMFAAYLKEREGVNLLETEHGFAIYVISPGEVYIRDIYVYPEHRRKHVASGIADLVADVARRAGCKVMTGSVCPSANGSTASIDVLRGYGMRLHSAQPNLIIFIKDLV